MQRTWAGPRVAKVRAVVLAHSRICHLCGLPGADTVDHVIPRSQRPDLMWDFSEHAPGAPVLQQQPPGQAGVHTGGALVTIDPETLAVTHVPLADLRTHPRNPRRGDVDVIAESLAANGQYQAHRGGRGRDDPGR